MKPKRVDIIQSIEMGHNIWDKTELVYFTYVANEINFAESHYTLNDGKLRLSNLFFEKNTMIVA
jgi:hypothetical protein